MSIATANANRLKDNSIPMTTKLQIAAYLQKDKIIKLDSLIALIPDMKSRSDIIEKAIDFYFGYLTSQYSLDYLCGVFGAKIEGLVNSLGTRISRGNFRTAVELSMLTRLLATEVQVSRTEYDKLRSKSIQDVKKTNGSIDFLEALNEAVEEKSD